MTNSESDFTVTDGVLSFDGNAPFRATVKGRPINSYSGGRKGQKRRDWKEERKAWKKRVTHIVKDERERAQWKPADRYAVTLQFRFCPNYENEKRDVDNYVKPVLDGLRDGLGVDDSRFRILLIRRLDVESKEEGVRIFVSSTGKVPDDTKATH